MRTRIVLFLVALALVMAGCSSSDPTTSNEYAELEQELAQSETQLTQVAAERNALAEEVAAVPAANTPNTVPDEVAALTTAWCEAINRDDGSVTDLYRKGGFHLYGADSIPLDDIAFHLEAGTEPRRMAHGAVPPRQRGRRPIRCGTRNACRISIRRIDHVLDREIVGR